MNHCNFSLIHIHVLIVAVLRCGAPCAGVETPRGNCDTVTALIEGTDPGPNSDDLIHFNCWAT